MTIVAEFLDHLVIPIVAGRSVPIQIRFRCCCGTTDARRVPTE
jgi:hypothetical protein